MDPYDVLGLRRNASQQEIDLAYRGRRTQYHPDRYQSSDAETLAWATEKMKSVNAAHAILSDPAKRSAYDQRGEGAKAEKAQTSTSAQAPAPAQPRSQPVDANIAMALRAVAHRARGFERVFLAPNIPMHKLSPALISYGQGLGVQDVLALVDNTVFGGAKEGLMLTREGLRYKEFAQSPGRCPWRDVKRMDASDSKLFLNTRPFMNCSVVQQHELNLLVEAISHFLADRDREQPQPQPQAQAAEPTMAPRPGAASPAAASKGPLPFHDLFEKACDEVISVGNFVAKFESPQEKLVDKKLIFAQFERFKWVQQHGQRELLAYAEQQLRQVLKVCEVWPEVMRDPDHPLAVVLIQPVDDDCELVAHLRELLLWLRNLVIAMLEHNRQVDLQAEQARIDRFFGRQG